ncbi:hypothetical protein CU097_004024 [Rhizopus azygosporus]|uniref:Ras-GEF domain-containing protein n=1 Tax=Rhizopus azygosporus TaxID=86630 RepID=A0A367J3L8_RHIAZ|nr:hypothetical protein CU097_004024 [Rhizopus azygosporus]
MEDPQSLLTTASHHFENGQIKDAYQSFLTTAQNAIKPLFDVKFVHCSIVSKPQNHEALLCILRTCIDQIEKIIEHHSISSNKSSPYPPPLPPKPSASNSKPVLPPKPTRPLPTMPALVVKTEQDAGPTFPPVPDGEIDPNHLVPAQTNNNDSLTPPGNSNHIPKIPVPPLLTTHRVLQAKLDELESSLNEYRTRKRQLSLHHDNNNSNSNNSNNHMTENELDDAISKYTPYVAEAKQTLNRVRTIYMSAATIPSILHFHPGIIAYQITRIESAIFMAIPPQALLTHSPKTPHPRIVASTDFFNFITRAIEHSILLPQEASSRAQHIHHWIKIATKCQELNNYQTLKAIVSALGTPPVQRLKRTWAYIPKKSMSKLEALNELMSESNNYGKYREHMGIASTSVLGKGINKMQLEHCKRPTVPFLGTFIHDMTYLLAAVQQQIQQEQSIHVPVRTSSRPDNRSISNNADTLQKDSRVQKLLHTLALFQSCPPYDKKPNSLYAKAVQKNTSPVRPALSQAIHRSKSSFGRLGGAIGLGGNSYVDSASEISLTSSSSNDSDDDFDIDEQSSLVTQYILMRPWVSQDTVDELSLLREPPRSGSRQNSGPTRSNSVGSHYASSFMSNTSSFMRLSASGNSTTTNASSSTLESRPESLDDFARFQGCPSPLAENGPYKDEHDTFNISPTSHLRYDRWDEAMSLYSKVPIVPPRPRANSIMNRKLSNEPNSAH